MTIDNDEYVYAAAYADALRAGDSTAAVRIAKDYVRYMVEVFSFFEQVSRRTIGREIPQVLLLHANSLNADKFGAIAKALVRRGYRFVPLAAALEDPAYRLPDTFVGAPSNSWFNHWEISAGRNPVPTPKTWGVDRDTLTKRSHQRAHDGKGLRKVSIEEPRKLASP